MRSGPRFEVLDRCLWAVASRGGAVVVRVPKEVGAVKTV